MAIRRDISFLWSMLHVIVLFLLLFEPRCSWKAALIAGFAGCWGMLSVNVLLMFWRGHGIIMSILQTLSCQVDLPEALDIPDEELAAFLMNMLSNALDAAKEIVQGQPKWVEIAMHIQGKHLFIEGQNTYAWAPEPGEDGERYIPGPHRPAHTAR